MNRKLNKKVLVIGDVMLDHYIYGDCNRISPEAPVPIIENEKEEYLLGGAANVAHNLKALSLDVCILGVIGNDVNGLKIKEILKSKDINEILYIIDERKSTVKTRVISGSYQLIRIDNEEKNNISEYHERKILEIFINQIAEYSHIIISDYNKGFLTERILKEFIFIAKQYNIPVLVDPKKPPFNKYFGADIIKPNRSEAFSETGIKIHDNQSIKQACELINKSTGIETVILTLSEDGVAIYHKNDLKVIPTKAKNVCDVTGAGDTFLAALTYGLLNMMSIIEACTFANYASATVLNTIGNGIINLNDINNLILKENE